MSIAEEEKFVIKHTFTDVMNMEEEEEVFSKPEYHFNVPWCVSIYRSGSFDFYMNCQKDTKNKNYQIEAAAELKVKKVSGEETTFSRDLVFIAPSIYLELTSLKNMGDYLIDGNVTIECHVTIRKMTGIKQDLRRFDESIEKFSDVVLVVQGKKFHVLKQYLAVHSSYFKSLLFGNFDESKQSEVELKDIESRDLQNFLELIHGEPAIDEDNLEGILKLADFFDSETATRQCEKFLSIESKRQLNDKFKLAVKYKMDQLTKSCISEMKTASEIRSAIPEDLHQMDQVVWNELLLKALALIK